MWEKYSYFNINTVDFNMRINTIELNINTLDFNMRKILFISIWTSLNIMDIIKHYEHVTSTGY